MIMIQDMGVKRLSGATNKLWLFYFLLSVALVGLPTAYTFCIPLYCLGRLFPRFETPANTLLQRSVHFLMRLQPWYKAHIALTLPVRQPGQPILLVSNHRSHLDVFILLSQIPGIKILAKSTLFKVPFLAVMLRMTRQIAVPRGRLDAFFAAMEEVRRRLRQGEVVHIFPEMTRCSWRYKDVQNFSAAPFLVAMQEKALIVPIVFSGTDEAWPKGFFGLNRGQTIRAFSLAPIESQNYSSVEALKVDVQKKIEAALL